MNQSVLRCDKCGDKSVLYGPVGLGEQHDGCGGFYWLAKEHDEKRHLTLTPEVVSRCSCGEHWSHPANRTPEQMDSIYQSHLTYAKRIATRVD